MGVLLKLSCSLNNSLKKQRVYFTCPKTFVTTKVLKILYEEGFLSSVVYEKGEFKVLLKYKHSVCMIKGFKLITKRYKYKFCRLDHLKSIRDNKILIVSTSSGLYTNSEAILRGLGGVVICEINCI